MLAANRFAFKEWAVICAALGEGRQSVILRKGGIHEGRAGFHIAHSELWLFPTWLHQIEPDTLTPEAQPLLERALAERPSSAQIPLQYYAVVQQVHEIQDESLLPRLEGLHLWSHRTVVNRFHYRQPGLFALAVRVYRLPEAIWIPDSPHFGGCRTWVDLPRELETAGCEPVLSDAEFEERNAALSQALAPSGIA